MSNALTRKLARFTELSAGDREALVDIQKNSRPVSRGQTLIRECEKPTHVFLILDGWACRYKILPDGKRQIVAFLMPGDLCDTHVFILERMDHTIAMLTVGVVAAIPAAKLLTLIDGYPRIAKAFWWATLVDEGTLREWLVNIGARSGFARVCHLLCELAIRAGGVDRSDQTSVVIPLTQTEIGDALGLTAVHVNRMVRRLNDSGVVSFRNQCLRINDMPAMKRLAAFDAGYLHARTVAVQM